MNCGFRMLCILGLVSTLPACGNSFSGVYKGTLTDSGSCSDGSRIDQSGSVTWTIRDDGDSLTVNANGNCDPYSAAVVGNVGTFAQKTCPSVTVQGGKTTMTVTGGSLELSGETLQVKLSTSSKVELGDRTGTCSTLISGTLSRTAQ